MYTVTCSSCTATEKSPFARVGAVRICPACKAKVQLRVEDVKRQFKLRLEGDDDLFKISQIVRPEEPVVPVPAADAISPPAGATTIHEDHAELAIEADRRAEDARRRRPKAQSLENAGLTGAALAQHLANKRKMKNFAVAGGLGVAAVFIIILIVAAGGGNTPVDPNGTGKDSTLVIDPNKDAAAKDSTNKNGTVTPPITPGKDGTLVSKDGNLPDPINGKTKTPVEPPKPAIVRVPALPLGIDDWQPTNEAFQVSIPTNRVVVVNEARENQNDGGQLFTAQVTSQGVASALVTVALVNDEDRVYARFERPYFLIDPKRPREIHLSIPAQMIGRTTTICWQVVPIDTHVTNMALLEDTLAELQPGEDAPIMRISAYNGTAVAMKDSAFVIQGLDNAGHVISQWRLKYPQEIDSRSWVKFEAQMPALDVKRYASWRVLGAGLPGKAPPPPVEVVRDPQPGTPGTPGTPAVDPGERIPDENPRRGRGLFDF